MRQITKIHGFNIDIDNPDAESKFLRLFDHALLHASEIAALQTVVGRGRGMKSALFGALQSVNALLGAVSAKCNLATPPEDIEVTQNKSGALIYRCYHSPAHEWSWDGQQLP
jgi:hypothetical protein